MKTVVLGTATIAYNPNGKVKNAFFTPEKIESSPTLLNQLREINSVKDVDDLQHNAELILADFFTKTSDAELADRDQWQIKSQVLRCEKYEDDNIKLCEIKFILEPLQIFSDN